MSSLSGTSLLGWIPGYGSTISAGGASSTDASTQETTASGSLPTRDTLDLQSGATLLGSLDQPDSSSSSLTGYPTNLQQAAQNMALLANDPDLAGMLAQASSSPLLNSLSIAAQVLDTLGNNSTEGVMKAVSTSLTAAASSMSQLQTLVSSGVLQNNSAAAQSLLQAYAPGVTTAGSTVDETA